MFEKDNRLVTRVDLPGMKKEDVSVEVTDGHLALSGERKRETEEKKDNFYRSEREYGSFYRAVPLPEGVKLEDVKATFSDGVLEVSVPLVKSPRAQPGALARAAGLLLTGWPGGWLRHQGRWQGRCQGCHRWRQA